jgi:hypothetical protein
MIDRLELDMIRDVRNDLEKMSIIISDVISSCGIVRIRGKLVLLLKEGVPSLSSIVVFLYQHNVPLFPL